MSKDNKGVNNLPPDALENLKNIKAKLTELGIQDVTGNVGSLKPSGPTIVEEPIRTREGAHVGTKKVIKQQGNGPGF